MEEINNSEKAKTINNQTAKNYSSSTNQRLSLKLSNSIKVLLFVIFLFITGIIVAFFLLKSLKKNANNQDNHQTQEVSNPQIVETKTVSQDVIEEPLVLVIKEGDSLYFLNSENNKVKISDNVGYYSLSTDKLKIAYLTDPVISTQDPFLYLYHLPNNSIEKIPTKTEITPTAISWSPNDQYLILNYGTDVVRNIKFLNYSNKEEFLEIQAFVTEKGKTIDWLDDNTFVYGEVQKVTPEIPFGSGNSSNISKMSIDTKQKEILQKADGLTFYSLIQVKNNTIYFKKMSVTNYDDWSNPDKQDISYWQVDQNGDNLTQIDEEITL